MTPCLCCNTSGLRKVTSTSLFAGYKTTLGFLALPCFTWCMLCIKWPILEGTVWHVNIKIQHRGHIKRLFNPIIQQAAVQKADAGKHWAFSVPCCPLLLLHPPSSLFVFYTLAMTVLSVNINCLHQPYNHIVTQIKPSAKPLLSDAWVISDTRHFHFMGHHVTFATLCKRCFSSDNV